MDGGGGGYDIAVLLEEARPSPPPSPSEWMVSCGRQDEGKDSLGFFRFPNFAPFLPPPSKAGREPASPSFVLKYTTDFSLPEKLVLDTTFLRMKRGKRRERGVGPTFQKMLKHVPTFSEKVGLTLVVGTAS